MRKEDCSIGFLEFIFLSRPILYYFVSTPFILAWPAVAASSSIFDGLSRTEAAWSLGDNVSYKYDRISALKLSEVPLQSRGNLGHRAELGCR